MSTKRISIFLMTFIVCTATYSMEINPPREPKKLLFPEGTSFPIEEIWLNIIARCKAKDKMRATCTYFRYFASVANEKIFLQNPLVIKSELLEERALLYADLDNNAVIKNLLNHGLNPNIIGKRRDQHVTIKTNMYSSCKDVSLLNYATNNKNFHMIDLLLSRSNFDHRLIIKSFGAALHRHCLTMAKHLLNINTVDMLTPTYIAHASDENLGILMHIFSLKDNPSILSPLLEHATRNGHIKLTELLLERGANVHGSEKSSPIHNAVRYPRILELLIEYGANINEGNPNPLHKYLTTSDCFNGIQFLIYQGASLVTQPGRSPLLFQAVDSCTLYEQNVSLVQLLLNKGVDVNEKSTIRNNCTALHVAADYRRTPAIPLLLAHPDIEINALNINGKTPLDLAIIRRDCEEHSQERGAKKIFDIYNNIIQLLIDKGGKTSNELTQIKKSKKNSCTVKDKMRATCTYFKDFASIVNEQVFLQNSQLKLLEERAFLYADLDNNTVITNLLNQGLNPNIISKNRDPYAKIKRDKYSCRDMSLLNYATNNENFSMINLLLNHPNFDPKLIIKSFNAALKRHCLTVAKHLLTVNTVDMLTPTYIARASDQNLDILAHIVSLKDDPNTLSPLLEHATRHGHIKLTELLLEHGANVHGSKNASPIHHAVRYPRILKLLIEYGANINEGNPTPLNNYLTTSDCFNGIQFLIDHGASLVTQPGRSPLLFQAVDSCLFDDENVPLVLLLLNKGVDVNEKSANRNNCTALHVAAEYRRIHAIPLLLAHPDIQINPLNDKNLTPLDLAINRRDREKCESGLADYNTIIQLLIDKGGKTNTELTQIIEEK